MLKDIEKKCSEKGISLKEIVKIRDGYNEIIWYGGSLIVLKKGDVEGVISIIGDVNFTVIDENGDDCYHYYNKNNSGAFDDSELLEIIPNDDVLKELNLEGRLDWVNNNWVEFDVYRGKEKIFHVTDCDTTTINEILADIDYYIEKVLEY